MSAEGERRANAGSPAFGADEVENVLAHLQHPIEAADVAGGRADQDLHARFPVPRWCCGPILRAAHPLRSAGSRSQVSGAISPTICRPFVGCQPHGANLLRRLSQAPQRAGRSKPRNSTAHSLSRCDGQVRTRRTPKPKGFCGFRRMGHEPQCDGCDGWVRTPTSSKTFGNPRLSGRRVRRWVRTANPESRPVASDVSGGAPRARSGPGSTCDFSDLAEETAQWRRFCSSSRPAEATSKHQAKLSKAKQPAPESEELPKQFSNSGRRLDLMMEIIKPSASPVDLLDNPPRCPQPHRAPQQGSIHALPIADKTTRSLQPSSWRP